MFQLPVKVQAGNSDFAMLIVYLSMNGAKIKHSKVIDGQNTLRVKLGGGRWHISHIKWNNSLFVGVVFKTHVDVETYNLIMVLSGR